MVKTNLFIDEKLEKKASPKTNMYDWVKSWNPLGGECPHNCSYCYRQDMMKSPYTKSKYTGEPRLFDVPIPKTDKVIFVCSMQDLFAEEISEEIIEEVLQKCREQPNNNYLFQSKNPRRFSEFNFDLKKIMFGTTIESNRIYKISKAPNVRERQYWIGTFYPRMVSIEPILDFDLDTLVNWMKDIEPEFVSIGADSKNHNLPEPSPEKVRQLIRELKKITEVKVKSNLRRVIKHG